MFYKACYQFDGKWYWSATYTDKALLEQDTSDLAVMGILETDTQEACDKIKASE